MRPQGSSMERANVKTTVYIPESLHYRLKLLAVRERSSIARLVMEAIQDLLAERDEATEGEAR
jgi:hypothetical protein